MKLVHASLCFAFANIRDPSAMELPAAPPPPAPRRRRFRKLVRVVVLLAVAISLVAWAVGCTSEFREFLSRSMVWGPNTDRVINEADDLPESNWSRRGVARQLRFNVGSPEV